MPNGIKLEAINKIFGDDKSQALFLLKQGATNIEIKEDTGCHVALREINLSIPNQKIYCLMGLSGSGKSTLIRHINRLIEPDLGQIWVGELNVTNLDEKSLREFRQQRVSMVFQHFGLFQHLSVLENTEFALKVRGVNEAEMNEQARYWLNEVGLSGYEHAYHSALSGGMQQRVGLARALAAGTDILLMDEPFSALDPLIRTKLQSLLLGLQDRLQKTIVFVTHDIDEARNLGGQVALMKDGEIVQAGSIDDLEQFPNSEYVQSFMQAKR